LEGIDAQYVNSLKQKSSLDKEHDRLVGVAKRMDKSVFLNNFIVFRSRVV